MKRILVITVLIAAASSYAQGQSKDAKSRSIEQQFMQLQRAEDEAESKKFESELRYPAEDGEYEKGEMDKLGL